MWTETRHKHSRLACELFLKSVLPLADDMAMTAGNRAASFCIDLLHRPGVLPIPINAISVFVYGRREPHQRFEFYVSYETSGVLSLKFELADVTKATILCASAPDEEICKPAYCGIVDADQPFPSLDATVRDWLEPLLLRAFQAFRNATNESQ